VKHEWELTNPGMLTIQRRYVCFRCGTEIQCSANQVPDAVSRQKGVPDDCDDAVAYHIHIS
jgi:hypothetical protein